MPFGPADPFPERLVKAVMSAYNKSQLSSLLRFKGGMILENEVNTDAPFRKIVEDLVVLLEQNDDLAALLQLALGGRPNNSSLLALAQEQGLAAPDQTPAASSPVADSSCTLADFVAAARTTLPHDPALEAVAERIGADAATVPANLEALVARRSRPIDFGRFQQRLDEVEERVCKISTPDGAGTGFLVGPALVLTNYHVVERLIGGAHGFSDVVCEFDLNSSAPEATRVQLAGPPTSHARYSRSDMTGAGEPAEDELDYALLPLSQSLGDGGRGYYALDPVPRLLTLGDFMFVCQHPGGQQLQLAMGTITDFPGKALRIRYDVTTDHGSSGSPCFTAELDAVGLHHAAEPARQPRYNQAVPLWLIARHARAMGALP